MPDLITHFTAAYLLKVPPRWARFRIPFYLGAILPDLLSRPIYIIHPPAAELVYTFHTPLVSALICLLIAMFFEKKIRSGIRVNLLLGVALHFGLDLLQKTPTVSYRFFFPLSWKSFSIGLFWPEDSLRLVPVWVILLIVIEGSLQIQKRIKKNEK